VRYFRDVTEARNASHKLEIAAEEWRRTFDSISDAVSIQDSDFRLVKVNRAYARMLGKEPQDLLGKRCYEVVHQCERPVDRCPHQHTLKTGKPGREEFYEPNLGVFLEVTTSPVFDEDGKAVGSVHVARDITARREMQDQLLLADRLSSIGELVSGVAHELNNPLTRVVESSYLLMERELPEEVKEDVGVICGEARRAARIVRDLVSFAGKHAQVKQVCRLNDIVEDVLRLRAYQQSVSNIEVARRLSPDLPDIMVDCFQIQQVFLNIIINAEYFMTQAHQHGTLTVSTERLGGILRASFADDGPGIAPENIGRVFNPFFTTKEAGKGTGLGLSVSHRIVAEHGGRIYVNSQPGAGATFVVELPPAEGSGPKQSEGGQPGPA
jgi:PAS domain S-box-containing protein